MKKDKKVYLQPEIVVAVVESQMIAQSEYDPRNPVKLQFDDEEEDEGYAD